MYCPHCNCEIDHLMYKTQTTSWGSEWGTCSTEGDNWDYEDSETNDTEYGDTEYNCPECENSVYPRDLLLDDPEDEEDNDENDEDYEINNDNKITKNVTDGQISIKNDDSNSTTTTAKHGIKTIQCDNCKTEFLKPGVIDIKDKEESILCPNCDYEILIN